jgi:hypothetical protein
VLVSVEVVVVRLVEVEVEVLVVVVEVVVVVVVAIPKTFRKGRRKLIRGLRKQHNSCSAAAAMPAKSRHKSNT